MPEPTGRRRALSARIAAAAQKNGRQFSPHLSHRTGGRDMLERSSNEGDQAVKSFSLIRLAVPLALAVALLSGCGPTVIGLGIAAGTRALSERNERDLISDSRLRFLVNGAMKESASTAGYLTLGAEVFHGRVLMTGTLPTEEDRQRVAAAVADLEGVKEILNEIEVGIPGGIADYATDLAISTALDLRIAEHNLIEEGIDVEKAVVNRVVYLIGISKSSDARQRLLDIVSETQGVQRVVNYVKVSGAA